MKNPRASCIITLFWLLSNPIIEISSPTALENSVRSHATAWLNFNSIDQSIRKIMAICLKKQNWMFCGWFLLYLIKSDVKFQADRHKQTQILGSWKSSQRKGQAYQKHNQENRLFITYIAHSFFNGTAETMSIHES